MYRCIFLLTRSFAACVYTGNETKFGMNKKTPEMKLTHSDRMINWFTVLIFCFQLVLVALFGPAGVRNMVRINKWYIDNHVDQSHATKYFVIPMRFLLLNSSVIPISLKVTLEVCKVIYTMFINNDEHLFVFLFSHFLAKRSVRNVSCPLRRPATPR